MRRLLALGAVLLLAARALAEPSALVSLATAQKGSLAPEVTAYGTVAADPNKQIAVVAGREARIAQVFVHPGQSVRRGDPLVTLLNSPNAQSQFAQAQSALTFARRDLAQTRRLYAEQLATRSQLAAAERAYRDALAASGAQGAMGAGQTGPLLAPADGVVTTLTGGRGDIVAPGATVAIIAGHAGLVVNLGLEPRDAARTRNDGAAWIEDPSDRSLVPTQLISVGRAIDPQSRTVNTIARADGALLAHLLVGMTVKVRIRLEPQAGIVIPRAALMADADGTFVWTVKGGIAHRRVVTVAVETERDALVTAGLSAREQVVATGTAGVSDGARIRTR